ncbi:hypothetical protein NM962_20005 [Mycobacterium sp. SVM_VP21]|nr:hypothetical protein NM962_20005 [Mycobacterium sp. SVM_VP21]
MARNAAGITINVWINDERLKALQEAGMEQMAKDAFAGMKLLSIEVTEAQKDSLLERYASAKYDSSTTGSIELLPKRAKDELLELAIRMHSTGYDVTEQFIESA